MKAPKTTKLQYVQDTVQELITLYRLKGSQRRQYPRLIRIAQEFDSFYLITEDFKRKGKGSKIMLHTLNQSMFFGIITKPKGSVTIWILDCKHSDIALEVTILHRKENDYASIYEYVSQIIYK